MVLRTTEPMDMETSIPITILANRQAVLSSGEQECTIQHILLGKYQWEIAVRLMSHSVETNPHFVSTSTNNFALAPSSPAIDAGLNLGHLSVRPHFRLHLA